MGNHWNCALLTWQKKQQNFAWLSSYRYCTDHSQNLPGPAPEYVHRVLQISPKSVHFWQRYSRTRESRQTCRKVNRIFSRSLALSWIIREYCVMLSVPISRASCGGEHLHQTACSSDSSSRAEVAAVQEHPVRDPLLWHESAEMEWWTLPVQTWSRLQQLQTMRCRHVSAWSCLSDDVQIWSSLDWRSCPAVYQCPWPLETWNQFNTTLSLWLTPSTIPPQPTSNTQSVALY